MIRIQIPVISDNKVGYRRLFRLWKVLHDHPADVVFDFSRCRSLRHNGVAFLGGLARLIQSQRRKVQFDWSSVGSDILKDLKNNAFCSSFGIDVGASDDVKHIPYSEYCAEDANTIIKYLQQDWLGKGWVNLSVLLRDAIVGRIWELYTNAFEHSGAKTVFSCGQYYPQRHLLKLTVVDFGAGIPQRVRQYFPDIADIQGNVALEWACEAGTTTQPNGAGRGLGLDLVKEFVRVNKGALQIFSGDGYATFTAASERYHVSEEPFGGTMVNITFRCDERFYFLTKEKPSEKQQQLF